MALKMKIKKLYNEIYKLHQQGAYHVKRGFSLKDASALTASNHLIEEAVELQAEVTLGNTHIDIIAYEKAVEEAADVLLVFLHLTVVANLSLYHIIKKAKEKLKQNFTLDKSKIKTNTPGFNRSNRDNNYSLECIE